MSLKGYNYYSVLVLFTTEAMQLDGFTTCEIKNISSHLWLTHIQPVMSSQYLSVMYSHSLLFSKIFATGFNSIIYVATSS